MRKTLFTILVLFFPAAVFAASTAQSTAVCVKTQTPVVQASITAWLSKLPPDVGRPNAAQLATMVQQVTGVVCSNGIDATTLSPQELMDAASKATANGGVLTSTPGVQFSGAQGGSSADTASGDLSKNAKPANCFDFYRFGSVEARLSTTATTTDPGETLHIVGSLKNDNPYPIVDGTLYVKVFRDRSTSGAKDKNGPDVVDEFVALNNIDIPAGGVTPISFDWKVPGDARGGSYEIGTFVSVSSRYNLLGLAFTDDVVGSGVGFTVSGSSTGVYLDKTTVTLDDNPYVFAAFPPHVSKSAAVPVSIDAVNGTSKAQTMTIVWKLYRWDQQREQNYITTEEVTVQLAPHQTKRVKYSVTDTTYPVYELVADAHVGQVHSILNMRIVRDGIEGARINFPGISAFPLVAGKSATLFSCVHSMNAPLTHDTGLELTLTDSSGNTIESATYHGSVTGNMMGIADNFTPSNSYDRVTLYSRLTQGGAVVEENTVTYDCNDIDPAACTSAQTQGTQSSGPAPQFSGGSSTGTPWALFAMIVALVLALIAFLGVRKFHV